MGTSELLRARLVGSGLSTVVLGIMFSFTGSTAPYVSQATLGSFALPTPAREGTAEPVPDLAFDPDPDSGASSNSNSSSGLDPDSSDDGDGDSADGSGDPDGSDVDTLPDSDDPTLNPETEPPPDSTPDSDLDSGSGSEPDPGFDEDSFDIDEPPSPSAFEPVYLYGAPLGFSGAPPDLLTAGVTGPTQAWVDDSALLLSIGDGLLEGRPGKFQRWLHNPGTAIVFDGPVMMDLYSAMKDPQPDKWGAVVVGLYDCDATGGGCEWIDSAMTIEPWPGSWGRVLLDFGEVDYTVPPGRSLVVHLGVTISSDDDLLFAFDAAEHPSRLYVSP